MVGMTDRTNDPPVPPGVSPPLSEAEKWGMANSTQAGLRGRLAALWDIDGELLRKLALDPDFRVRSSAIMQAAASTSLLEEVLQQYPEHEDAVARHKNSPLRLLPRLPIAQAQEFHLRRFLESQNASSMAAARLYAIQEREAHRPESETTLGQAWEEANGDS
jgi:hypothetical protein